jgi:hypothetical protein
MRIAIRWIAIAVVLSMFAVGCSKKDKTVAPTNHNPQVAAVVANPNSVTPGGQAAITVSASDSDGDTLAYSYTASGGTVTGTGAAATFTAGAPGSASVTASVSDGRGGTATGSAPITITVPTTCANMGTASYVGTEDVSITSGSCPSYTNLSVTFNIVQAPGGCTFTLQSSLVSGTTFAGTISDHQVSWTGSYPSASGTVTINSVSAVLSADLTTLTGSFDWTYAGNTHCTGTTTFNVVKQ